MVPHVAAGWRTSGPEKFRSSAKRDFFNTIGKADIRLKADFS
jgi:hypothetical protein